MIEMAGIRGIRPSLPLEKFNKEKHAGPLDPLALTPRATAGTNGKKQPGSAPSGFKNGTTGASGTTTAANEAERKGKRVREETPSGAAPENAREPVAGANGKRTKEVARAEEGDFAGEGRGNWKPEEWGFIVRENPEFSGDGDDAM
ncbi:hypothetical protein KFL_002970080 [Klebsormidium nitens]|uniref:Uncharacterized protein n=1 Tax=Klebsormidium nitens TaxID=105231 RepID=A0A1Y1I6J1_KLENI|nr:hypothetical protein KFL_002970080 [Klebsormidium nitens]|eukprot:GAQ86570.1 hypothetical protein KFL_002970080 [Klebsormidium nitens]